MTKKVKLSNRVLLSLLHVARNCNTAHWYGYSSVTIVTG